MAKTNVMISIDNDVIVKCRERGYNVSYLCNSVLKQHVYGRKNVVQDESISLKCSKCNSLVDYGFMCVERNKFYCEKCHIGLACLKADGHLHRRVPALVEEH